LTPEQSEQLARAAKDAGADFVELPTAPVYLNGPKPFGGTWCSVCAVLWLGHLSTDEAMRKFVRKAAEVAHAEGKPFVVVDLPEGDDKLPVLQLAITVGPTVYNANHTVPVCWTHLLPYSQPTEEQQKRLDEAAKSTQQPRLIPGKANWTPQ
jgi:hypothetical protein